MPRFNLAIVLSVLLSTVVPETLLVKRGNIIKANDTELLTINQIIPISVAFSVPEQSLTEIKKYMARGMLKVEALPPNDTRGAERGVLTFIDNAIDKATGSILLKGTFANKGRRLWPGQFVDVVLRLTTQPDAIIVPSRPYKPASRAHMSS